MTDEQIKAELTEEHQDIYDAVLKISFMCDGIDYSPEIEYALQSLAAERIKNRALRELINSVRWEIVYDTHETIVEKDTYPLPESEPGILVSCIVDYKERCRFCGVYRHDDNKCGQDCRTAELLEGEE